MEVSNWFYALETLRDMEDIEDYWNKIKGIWKGSCEEVLGLRGKVFNRVILERLNVAFDEKLRKEQASSRKGKSCADQTATICIIVEQSLEWNSPLFVNFGDFEKAFDSVDRESL
ncbi:hypothetical protein ElyMa_001919700 [Elysia marginata]|uniref:Reverse transcriptase domain-containing protein n=1 Tax=Elysia marginata TaxID=1093978 RepID=A0AAV4EU79_9GAST|nr:hypothetical protein ElyMa_001919700 [Elysia marginata]